MQCFGILNDAIFHRFLLDFYQWDNTNIVKNIILSSSRFNFLSMFYQFLMMHFLSMFKQCKTLCKWCFQQWTLPTPKPNGGLRKDSAREKNCVCFFITQRGEGRGGGGKTLAQMHCGISSVNINHYILDLRVETLQIFNQSDDWKWLRQ